ncbi:dihydrofolate reductase family protein [Falsibacillus albus]|uniref:Dihydrofolate reductase n=1 Tax=Falsibacillus albus TaxID=2478915 RepID=A0A3L7K2Z1_9BACI|nr:dihydrofolate reductase family protein [Falsibacillus albus]RLQ97403.1 dihydrofolate reductase [Falsibacillus albus]
MSKKRNIVLYIAASLDGYIAREDDSLDWLFKVEGEGDNGYSDFYGSVDSILIGRKTYDWVMEHEKGNFPYKDKDCYVFSNTESDDHEYVKFINGDIAAFSKQLKNQPGNNIWLVGGGGVIHSFMKEKLIDEIRLTVAPTIIGKGIPLFSKGDFEFELELIDIKRFNQFVELNYVVKK